MASKTVTIQLDEKGKSFMIVRPSNQMNASVTELVHAVTNSGNMRTEKEDYFLQKYDKYTISD